jgi:hypothetical protein
MLDFRKPTLRAILAALSVAVVAAIIIGSDFIINGSKAKQERDELEKEMSLIATMPQAIPQSHHSSAKPRQALVGQSYTTRLGYIDIRAYYDRELSRLGWTLNDEGPIRDWGRDFGGKRVEYCKGEYTASLQYAGENADYGWTYALELSWGLHNCK